MIVGDKVYKLREFILYLKCKKKIIFDRVLILSYNVKISVFIFFIFGEMWLKISRYFSDTNSQNKNALQKCLSWASSILRVTFTTPDILLKIYSLIDFSNSTRRSRKAPYKNFVFPYPFKTKKNFNSKYSFICGFPCGSLC